MHVSDQISYHLNGNVEKMAEALKDSDMIKIAQLESDGDKDQSDTGAALSAGVTHDELPMATITVKGMYI